MYNIRFHGRGGQGMKTASRLLRSALLIRLRQFLKPKPGKRNTRKKIMGRILMTGNAAAEWAVRLAEVDYVPAFPITPQTEIIETLAHLFSPERKDSIIQEIQQRIDQYWENIDDA
jgi:hypothetical protein